MKRLKISLALIYLVIVSTAWVCSTRKLAQLSYTFEKSLEAAHVAADSEFGKSHISEAEHRAVLEALLEANEAELSLNDAIRAYDKGGDMDAVETSLAACQQAIGKGMLGVKNPESQQAIILALESARAMLTTLQASLRSQKGTK
jgi:hypothetical protein